MRRSTCLTDHDDLHPRDRRTWSPHVIAGATGWRRVTSQSEIHADDVYDARSGGFPAGIRIRIVRHEVGFLPSRRPIRGARSRSTQFPFAWEGMGAAGHRSFASGVNEKRKEWLRHEEYRHRIGLFAASSERRSISDRRSLRMVSDGCRQNREVLQCGLHRLVNRPVALVGAVAVGGAQSL